MKRRHFLKALAIGAAFAAVGRLPKALGDGSEIDIDVTAGTWDILRETASIYMKEWLKQVEDSIIMGDTHTVNRLDLA